MIVQTDFNPQLIRRPFYYRFMEGISTFCMPIGFLWAGGKITSNLFLIYILHSMISLCFHIFYSPLTYFLDTSMINLLIMERGYLLSQNLWIYILCLTSMFLEKKKSHQMVILRVGFVCILNYHKNISQIYLLLWFVTLIFFIVSCKYAQINHFILTTTTCIMYHIYLGLLSSVEVEYYIDKETTNLHVFSRYCFYFLFLSYMMTNLTRNPKRLCSILSFVTALCLSPISMFQIYSQLTMKEFKLYQDEYQTSILLFYLAYVFIDIIMGIFYYNQYFFLLDGWIHHIGTGISVFYYIMVNTEKQIIPCMSMIIETPTILLCLSRILYDVQWIQKLKKILFYKMFIIFRIIIPTMLIIYYHHFFDNFSYFIFSSTTSLNLYWLMKLSKK